MVMIGTDSHKRTHTVVAVDDVGRRLATKTGSTNSDGHLDLVRWSTQFDDVVFALEDCRHLTRRLESDLLIAGYRVVRVPTRLMAAERRGTKEPGKSDPIDAEAVALAALRYPDLPVAELEGPAREVKLLSDHRRDLVVQRTRIASQVRWFVHEMALTGWCHREACGVSALSSSCRRPFVVSAAWWLGWPGSCWIGAPS